MKPKLETLRAKLSGIKEDFIRQHLERLGSRYFERFHTEEISEHIRCLFFLDRECPVEVLTKEQEEGNVECTILACDYPSVFSLITGILAATGFDITSGDVFTYRRLKDQKPDSKGRFKKLRRTKQEEFYNRRKIIDFFEGYLKGPLTFEQWEKELRRHLQNVFR